MTKQEAETIHNGSKVNYRNEQFTVASVKVRGVAAPYFRLNGLQEKFPKDGSLISYQLCHKV